MPYQQLLNQTASNNSKSSEAVTANAVGVVETKAAVQKVEAEMKSLVQTIQLVHDAIVNIEQKVDELEQVVGDLFVLKEQLSAASPTGDKKKQAAATVGIAAIPLVDQSVDVGVNTEKEITPKKASPKAPSPAPTVSNILYPTISSAVSPLPQPSTLYQIASPMQSNILHNPSLTPTGTNAAGFTSLNSMIENLNSDILALDQHLTKNHHQQLPDQKIPAVAATVASSSIHPSKAPSGVGMQHQHPLLSSASPIAMSVSELPSAINSFAARIRDDEDSNSEDDSLENHIFRMRNWKEEYYQPTMSLDAPSPSEAGQKARRHNRNQQSTYSSGSYNNIADISGPVDPNILYQHQYQNQPSPSYHETPILAQGRQGQSQSRPQQQPQHHHSQQPRRYEQEVMQTPIAADYSRNHGKATESKRDGGEKRRAYKNTPVPHRAQNNNQPAVQRNNRIQVPANIQHDDDDDDEFNVVPNDSVNARQPKDAKVWKKTVNYESSTTDEDEIADNDDIRMLEDDEDLNDNQYGNDVDYNNHHRTQNSSNQKTKPILKGSRNKASERDQQDISEDTEIGRGNYEEDKNQGSYDIGKEADKFLKQQQQHASPKSLQSKKRQQRLRFVSNLS